MKITVDVTDQDMSAAFQAACENLLASTQLLTLQQAADMLVVSKQAARRLFKEDWVDLGACSPRIEYRKILQLIESRRVAS